LVKLAWFGFDGWMRIIWFGLGVFHFITEHSLAFLFLFLGWFGLDWFGLVRF